ncbi:hypothetical protein [Amycolatopsis sp. FDAARGOS 1241]|uniref:hypothetical protein n=1 Tax=Amycolatopsis sp. FDAARGOS 1241 TaxID=2778070 RepID=UPI0019528AF1|nr:hypothetical protein [Amycolatopsis sp. FDAARGOS 1241]QRP49165.1 hypothetical protein I6J71_16105 [Amycolatopsis sp. FDAARGOS 1241]
MSIELYVAPSRNGRRGQLLDCGAALLNLRLAVKAQAATPTCGCCPLRAGPISWRWCARADSSR